MKNVKIVAAFCIMCFLSIQVEAQKDTVLLTTEIGFPKPEIYFKTHSQYAPFPDSARLNGHEYEGKYFAYKDHYDDSAVQILIPLNFTAKKPIELFIWFHGWNNNIDSASGYYGLTEQFRNAGRNAIFIFPEGPKNAPDSYGGKLERPEMFALFINDLLKKIETYKGLPKRYTINDCKITLAGHSGAYRVISKIIQYNKIEELLLFDAMYGGNDAYLKWIAENKRHRFIHIYTKDGGTFENTNLIMQQLRDSLKVTIISVTEKELKMGDLKSGKPLFIYSDNEHNEVITWNSNLFRFLHRWKKQEQWLESKPLTKEIRNLKN
jgi:hypothetical protein